MSDYSQPMSEDARGRMAEIEAAVNHPQWWTQGTRLETIERCRWLLAQLHSVQEENSTLRNHAVNHENDMVAIRAENGRLRAVVDAAMNYVDSCDRELSDVEFEAMYDAVASYRAALDAAEGKRT